MCVRVPAEFNHQFRGTMSNQVPATVQQQSRLKELIAKGKEQGYLTYGEVNDHLPDEISDPEQIDEFDHDTK